jgi:hypothetical protein
MQLCLLLLLLLLLGCTQLRAELLQGSLCTA